MAAGALGEGVGGWPETSNELILRNGTWVGGIEVEVGIVNISVDVAGLVSNDLEDVGHAVPAAEGWKPPVYRDGGDGGVVVVEGRVSGTLKSVRDDATEKDGEDVVMLGVGLVLVEGEDDERVVHEIAVVQQRLEEVTGPGASKGDIGVMAIVGHIGGDEGPLGKGLGLQIILEGGEVLDEAETGGILGDGVKENERVVLADISVGVGLLVGEVEALEASIWQTLLVLTPRDTLNIEEINDGGDVSWESVEVVIVHAEVVTSSSGGVFWLGRMSSSKVAAEGDTLLGKELQIWVRSGLAIILK